ncbi:hypothetical protein C4565_00890 [Candidatus Parcubacteria bacterium]|jgi:hypothetical protein|nr:MAG: hypothetical protein C4565_00890 [Candidatus Parcubacteria bacterium]
MADNQFPNQNQWSEKPVIGTGEGESPIIPAPQNDVVMRTMASDTASIKEMGGGDPHPYTPTQQVGEQENKASTSPMNTTKDAVVTPPQASGDVVIPLPQKKGGNMFVILAVVIILLGLIAIGYFYVYPKFILGTPTPETITEETAPVVTNENIDTNNQNNTEGATTTENTSPIEVPPTTGLSTHTSLFKVPADFSSEATLNTETIEAIKETWKGNTVEVPVFRETIFKNVDGMIFGISKLATLFIPSVINSSSSKLFDEDFTLFTYTDQKGVWPGMILKAKNESLTLAKEEVKKIESNTEWLSLFMVDPGKEQTWKDGKVGTMSARYIPFSTQGNALSYTWFDNILLISTNYQGAQDAAKKLGF